MKFKAAQIKAVAKFDDPEFIANIKDEDFTMVKHLDILKKINQYGYLTTNSQAGRKTITIYERAYIQGFMMKKDAVEFIKNINIKTDKNAIVVSITNSIIDPKFDIPLSIQYKNKWEVFTHMSTTIPLQFWNQERTYLNLDNRDMVYIFCWDPQWNRNASSKYGLFTEVLKILKTI
jgi:uncharacterized protein YqfB (UPF0267 family)